MKDDKDFSEEFQELHDQSPYSNDLIDTDLYSDEEDLDSKALKKGKKKKKKNKKEKISRLRVIMDDFEDEDLLADDDSGIATKEDNDEMDMYLFSKKSKKGKKKDLFDIKQAKKKKKKNIEAKFAPQLVVLRKILKDTNTASENIQGILDRILNSKSRYVGKSLTDLLQALNTANSTRASVVRDIANINKTIVDLSMKQEKANPKKNDKDMDAEEYGIDFFRKVLSGNGSRKSMLDAARDYYNNDNSQSDDYYTDDGYDYDELNDDIEERLKEENNERRTEDGTKYIQYENMKPEYVIMYHANGEYELDAVDKYGTRMPDEYPRLNEEDLGNIRIELDQGFAIDTYGRKYRIIEVP